MNNFLTQSSSVGYESVVCWPVVLLNSKFFVRVMASQSGMFWLDEDSFTGSFTVGLVASSDSPLGRGARQGVCSPRSACSDLMSDTIGSESDFLCVCSESSFRHYSRWQFIRMTDVCFDRKWAEFDNMWFFVFFNNRDEKLDVTALLKTKLCFCVYQKSQTLLLLIVIKRGTF